jgi:hypothetical protein
MVFEWLFFIDSPQAGLWDFSVRKIEWGNKYRRVINWFFMLIL